MVLRLESVKYGAFADFALISEEIFFQFCANHLVLL